MAFTKIVSPGIDTTGSYIVQELNTVGVVTAGTVQVGSATTVHTTGIDLGSGNITSHNINSTGIITATSFVGPVTGNITGDITATSGTFSGNVSIGGTLTYEDVTNVDSVGIITAQSGIKVTSGDILLTGGDGRKISFAGDGSAHYIKMDNTFNGPVINGYGGIKFETNGTNERLRISSNGAVGINTTADIRQLEIFNTSHATAALKSDTQSSLFFSDNDTNIGQISYMHSDNYMYFRVNDAERLRITSDGLIGINHQNPTVGLSINKYGTQPVPSGNTYTYPAGNWSTVWNYTTTNNTDYWCGFAGGYDISSSTVNISLSPNVYNFNAQAGIYIAGEATSNSSADFTLGKIIGGSVAGVSTVAGNQRATKSEMFRITSAGKIGIGISNPEANLDVFNTDSATVGTHGFQMGAFGIRTNDTGGYNHWYIERNYGGWQSTPLVTFKGSGQVAIGTASLSTSETFEVYGTTRLGGSHNYGSTTILNVAPGVVKWDTPGSSGGRLNADNNSNWYLNGKTYPVYDSLGVNMNDIYGVTTTATSNMGGWVYLGSTEHSSPYPRKAYKITAPDGTQGTFVYQVWFDGDANYQHGGLYEIRINNWAEGSRFTSVAITCINGVSSGLRVYAYNDANGIWITTDSIWGALFIRKFGYDAGRRSRGATLCAVDKGSALAEADVNGLSGTIPSGYTEVHANNSPAGGYNIETNTRFQAGQGPQ